MGEPWLPVDRREGEEEAYRDGQKHPAKDVQCMIGGCQEAWVGGSGQG